MTIASALTALNTDIVNARTAITNKGGTVTADGGSSQLATDIATIPTGGSSPVITSLSVTPTTSAQTITAPSGTDGYSPVSVAAVTASIDANITAGNIKKDVKILNVTGTYEGSGGGSITSLVPLSRFKDDNNNEIGTYYMNFQDANGNLFKVILLDAQYRKASGNWTSSTQAVTNMPTYKNLSGTNVWEAKETATTNTQLVIDSGYASTGFSHCRSLSFTIGGETYYGQLPNLIEVLYFTMYYNQLDALDISASSYPSTNFSTYRAIWSSSQYAARQAWVMYYYGDTQYYTKNSSNLICPVLEIPF